MHQRVVRVTLRENERIRVIGAASVGQFKYHGPPLGRRARVRVYKEDEFTRVFFGKSYDLAEAYRQQQLAILRAHAAEVSVDVVAQGV